MRVRLGMLALVVLAFGVAAGCGGGDSGTSGGTGGSSQSNVSGSISVMGIWSGPEQKAFQ